jgi:hypothetical protein
MKSAVIYWQKRVTPKAAAATKNAIKVLIEEDYSMLRPYQLSGLATKWILPFIKSNELHSKRKK